MQPHIVVVEDDREIATLVERTLRQNGFKITVAHDGRGLDRVIQNNQIDLILLDLMLPGEDGLSITRRIRTEYHLPIIMLTAMGEETDRIVGLEVGADDYVVKPFSSRELIARIRAVLRRSSGTDQHQSIKDATYTFEGWNLLCLQRELHNPDGVRIELTSAEFQLLQILCENPRQILSRESLLRLTQGRISTVDDRSIDTLISRIRRKIETDSKDPTLIKTIRLGGYLFTAEVDAQ